MYPLYGASILRWTISWPAELCCSLSVPALDREMKPLPAYVYGYRHADPVAGTHHRDQAV